MANKPYIVTHEGKSYWPKYLYRGEYRRFENCWDQYVEFKTMKEAVDFLNKHIDKVIAQQTEVIKHARDKIRAIRASRPK